MLHGSEFLSASCRLRPFRVLGTAGYRNAFHTVSTATLEQLFSARLTSSEIHKSSRIEPEFDGLKVSVKESSARFVLSADKGLTTYIHP